MPQKNLRAGIVIAICFSLSVDALAVSLPVTFEDASIWLVNINGALFSAQMRIDSSTTNGDGMVRGALWNRGQNGAPQSGHFELDVGGTGADISLNIPTPRGSRVECTGQFARDGSFVSGNCGERLPFIMVPTTRMQTARNVDRLKDDRDSLSEKVKACEVSLNRIEQEARVCDASLNRAEGKVKACQASLSRSESACQSSSADPVQGHDAARAAANRAANGIPFTSQGNCAKCDSVMKLNVPKNPAPSSEQGRWLSQLLQAQNGAIRTMFDTSGERVLRDTERDVCDQSLTCAALFRQGSIAAAAEFLRDE